MLQWYLVVSSRQFPRFDRVKSEMTRDRRARYEPKAAHGPFIMAMFIHALSGSSDN